MPFRAPKVCFSIARWWWVALLLLAAQPATAGQPTTKIDSLKRELRTARDTMRVKVLHNLLVYIAETDTEEAMRYAKQQLTEARRLGWKTGQAQGLEDIGRLHWRRGELPQAHQYMLGALSMWRTLRQERRALRAMFFMVELLGTSKQFDKALEWERQVLRESRAIQDTLAITRAYIGMGLLNSWQHRPNEARAYYIQALAMSQFLHEENTTAKLVKYSLIAVIHNNIGDTYIEENQPEKALQHLFKSIKMHQEFSPKTDIALTQNTLTQAYMKLRKWDMAIYHALKARKLSSEAHSLPGLITANSFLDTLYVLKKNYQESNRYLREIRQLEAKQRQQEQERRVAEIQERYDTEEKERNIKLLQQQNHIAQLSALQQRTLRNAALIGAGLLLLLLAVVYNRYRLRQRTVHLLDKQNQEKELLLQEKTLLLQEVHHRVKNNLQIILSLLSNQLDTLPDPAAAAAIRESRSRVQTMALIHQNLYQSDHLARIDMRRYLAELLDAIGRAFRRDEVAVTLDVAPVHLTTITAVPLGLVVNELVTNAYKYAFEGRTGNELRVELQVVRPATFRLVVADNGVGLPPLDLDMVQSLGLRLTAGLLRQMHAQVSVYREAGTSFHITFQEVGTVSFAAAARSAPASAAG